MKIRFDIICVFVGLWKTTGLKSKLHVCNTDPPSKDGFMQQNWESLPIKDDEYTI